MSEICRRRGGIFWTYTVETCRIFEF